MNIKALTNAVTSQAGRRILHLKKHSPGIMFAVGVAGVIGTVALACRATLKVEAILDEHENMMTKIEGVEDPEYTDHDRIQDKTLLYVRTGADLVKLYAPAVILGAISIASLTGAHVTLTRRNAAAMAAYAAIDKGFRAYRERVVKELGADKDREFRYGVETREIVEETDEGPVVKTVTHASRSGLSIYAKLFDEGNRFWLKDPWYNQMFVRTQQNYANDLLRARGHVLLNDVYDMLGFDRTKEGCVVGWVAGEGDDYIDFGVFEGDKISAMRFVMGDERSIFLDFNVDGIIYDKI